MLLFKIYHYSTLKQSNREHDESRTGKNDVLVMCHAHKIGLFKY